MKFDRILIDGNYWARKFFEVHKDLQCKVDGLVMPTGLAHGFLLALARLKEEYQGKVIICWDSGHALRKKIDSSYKAQRIALRKEWKDKDLYEGHYRILKIFLGLVGVWQAKAPGHEGDDILYTLAKRSEGRVLIVSNDHDMHQALDRGIYQLIVRKNNETLYSAKRLERETGLTPKKYAEVMAITGCSGDGIPGYKLVGIKKATEWITKWPNLVSALLGRDETSLTNWLPKVNKQNIVQESNELFEKGEKGPPKKVREIVKQPWIAHNTELLTRLYEIKTIKFSKGNYDEKKLVSAFERMQMHECETRLGIIRKIHR